MRISEYLALQWQDIDWDNGLIHVRRAIVMKKEKCTKTKAGKRSVLMLPPVRQALEDQYRYTSQQVRIFNNPNTRRPWNSDKSIRDAWRRLLAKTTIPYRNAYQTRHTYASMMVSKGENLFWLAKQMGHVTPEMLLKTYARWLPDNQYKNGYQPVNDWGKVLTLTEQSHPMATLPCPEKLVANATNF